MNRTVYFFTWDKSKVFIDISYGQEGTFRNFDKKAILFFVILQKSISIVNNHLLKFVTETI